MIEDKTKTVDTELSVEEKLRALYELQTVVSEIDKIKRLRGELPLEVQDLEDDIAGLQTRVDKIEDEMKELNELIIRKKNDIKDSEGMIKKYESQQAKVRNNREYDSITKEVEFQNLEIELSEKRIREFTEKLKEKKHQIELSATQLRERQDDLTHKKEELEAIIAETQIDEENLIKRAKEIEKLIESRLLIAFKRIRSNARNGLAVVTVARDACGGCFNQIPPQRQLDIRSRKKVIVCEHCGRVLVDNDIDKIDTEL
jgi:uncharacterized protein